MRNQYNRNIERQLTCSAQHHVTVQPQKMVHNSRAVRIRNRYETPIASHHHEWMTFLIPRTRKARQSTSIAATTSKHPQGRRCQRNHNHQQLRKQGSPPYTPDVLCNRTRSVVLNRSIATTAPPRSRSSVKVELAEAPKETGVGTIQDSVHLTPSPTSIPRGLPSRSAALGAPPLGYTPPVPAEIVIVRDFTHVCYVSARTESDFAPGRNNIVDDDVHSEISLDFDRVVIQLKRTASVGVATSNKDCPEDKEDGKKILDCHPLIQEGNHLPHIFPPLSKFHNSVTTHDSVWGITTTTLDECDDNNHVDALFKYHHETPGWPSDEEGVHKEEHHKEGDREVIKSGRLRRRGRKFCDSGQERLVSSLGSRSRSSSCCAVECWSPKARCHRSPPPCQGTTMVCKDHRTPQSTSTALTAATTVTRASRDDDSDDGRRVASSWREWAI